jgi:hypothetical protein
MSLVSTDCTDTEHPTLCYCRRRVVTHTSADLRPWVDTPAGVKAASGMAGSDTVTRSYSAILIRIDGHIAAANK